MFSFLSKKILPTSAILLFAFLFFLINPPLTFSQTDAVDTDALEAELSAQDSEANLTERALDEDAYGSGEDADARFGDESPSASAAAAVEKLPVASGPADKMPKCESLTAMITGDAWKCTALWIGNSALWLSSWFLDLTSVFLNQSIKFNLNIADFVKNTPGILIAWETIRDMSNIVFIFILLWISIQNILQMGDAKKMIPGIIIAALLINFSLFFTKVIIDTSNIVALQFYSGIVDPSQTGSLSVAGGGISDRFFQLTKIQSILTPTSEVGFFKILTISLMGVIFILITAFSFLSVSFIFLSRAVILILLMPLSPFAFVASLIPKTSQYSKMWWDHLWSQVLVAPIFLMFMWMILVILGGGQSVLTSATSAGRLGAQAAGSLSSTVVGLTAQSSGGQNLASAITSPDTGTVGIIFSFLIAIGLLLAAVKVTRDFSGAAGSKVSGLLATGAGAIAGGVGGFAGRQLIGRGAAALANNETFKAVAANNKFARSALQVTSGISKSSFDVRAAGETPFVGGLASKLAGATNTGVDLGKKPKDLKDGFVGDVKRAEEKLGKERAATAELLEAKKTPLSEEERLKISKLTPEEYKSTELTDAEKAGKSAEEIRNLRTEKTASLKAEKLKTAEAAKKRQATEERQKTYFDQLKSGKGEVIPQALKMGDAGATKKAEKDIDQKYKKEREITELEATIKNMMGDKGSVKDAINAFSVEAAMITEAIKDLGENTSKETKAKLIIDREIAKTNARTLQTFINRLDNLKDGENKKKSPVGGEKKEGEK
jgi:hypothetical protein